MNVPAWRACLRIARRDARRHRGRSALVVAMIALPVLGVTTGDVLVRSAQLTPVEQMDRTIGAADAQLRVQGGEPIEQSPDGRSTGNVATPATDTSAPTTTTTTQPSPAPPLTRADLASLLPPGSRLLPRSSESLRVRDAGGGVVPTLVDVLDYADPIAHGLYRQVTGRAPRTTDEIVLTTRLRDTLGVQVGDIVTSLDPPRTYTVVGTVEDPSQLRAESVVALPGAVDATDQGPQTYLADTPGSVTWDDVLALNRHGVVVTSRYVAEHPPPGSAVPYYQHAFSSGPRTEVVAVAVVVVGMALLEIVLLAGPAFAVGARRSRRHLALVAAGGGDRAHVRNIVLSGGIVLGLASGVLGVGIGVGLALAVRPTLERLAGASFGGLHLHPLEIVAIALLGLLTGVLAALLPARSAARQDVVAALTGRRGTTRTPRRLPAVGLVMLVAGVAIAAYAGLHASSATVILGGSVLAELGLVACSPALVALAGRLGPLLPAAPRLALRDAARNRGRTAPAVSAIMAAVAGSIALSVYVASTDAHDRQSYSASLRMGQAAVQLAPEDGKRIPAIETALQQSLPTKATYVVEVAQDVANGYAALAVPPANRCPLWGLNREPTQAERLASRRDWRCQEQYRAQRSMFNSFVVGSPTVFTALTGVHDPRATAVLARGGAVVFDRNKILAGTVTIQVTRNDSGTSNGTPSTPTSTTLPGVLVTDGFAPAQAFLSPAAATAAGLTAAPADVLVDTTATPTKAEETKARDALAQVGSTASLAVERGYHSNYGLGLLALVLGSAVITLGASAIVTGLASADSRPDFTTLAAIGASPRTRRLLAMFSSAVIALLGSVLGIVAGFVPALAVLQSHATALAQSGSDTTVPIVVPWPNVLAVAVLVPAIAALLAGLFTRSRLPLDRRIA